jgi:hypothetical protein
VASVFDMGCALDPTALLDLPSADARSAVWSPFVRALS